MKRKLISQMRNEWRSNLWMIIELIIVGPILFGIFGVFVTLAYVHQPPKGIDFTDIYCGHIRFKPQDASTYKAYPDSAHNPGTDLEILLANVKSNPHVESLGVGRNAIPYNYNYNGYQLCCQFDDSTQFYDGNVRYMSPDMIRTFRLTGYKGETSEALATMVDEDKILISAADRAFDHSDPEKWVGKQAWCRWDTATVCYVGAMINGIRRTDYEPLFNGVIIRKPPFNYISEIAVRVKPGHGDEFMKSLKTDDLEFGNAYISNLQSIEKRKDAAHRHVSTIVRNLSACALFVMIVIFLGFLGSFWYRTQQRIPELAIRKVNGATNANLFRRFISEGLLLLLLSAPFIAGLVSILISAAAPEFESIFVPAWLIWLMLPATLAVLALMIAAGIWMPARKAMNINPALALKDQ